MKSKNSDSPRKRPTKTASSVKVTASPKAIAEPKRVASAKAVAAPKAVKSAKAAKPAKVLESIEPVKAPKSSPVSIRKSLKKTPVAAAESPVESVPAAKAEASPSLKTPVKKSRLKVPAILLEGDTSPPPPVSGAGRRFALGVPVRPVPATPLPAFAAELPESYGTEQLFLTARDPQWLYASWDFTTAQLRKYNALSADGHLLLLVFRGSISNEPLLRIHLHPESRHWFVPVPYAGAKYAVTLGYVDASGGWFELARSGVTMTPPDSVSGDTAVRFASIPLDVPFEQLVESVKTAAREVVPLAEALQELRAEGHPALPTTEQIAGTWTPAQEEALAAVVSVDQRRRVWIASVEVTELIRRQLHQDISSIAAAQFSAGPAPGGELGAPTGGVLGGLSSPFGGVPRARGFWFNINAELIVYGATEADATVTIAGRKIKLRRDGGFSFRFALPDGQYELPVAATSADGGESRSAALSFSRLSHYHGGVEAPPRDEKLQAPSADSVG